VWPHRLIVDRTLAPIEKVFGYMSYTNWVKSIVKPLYRTGMIEESIFRETADGLEGVGGLRIDLQRNGDTEPMEANRTFSDGGYNAFGILPGKYPLIIDLKAARVYECKRNARFIGICNKSPFGRRLPRRIGFCIEGED
jgi:hypothetical protein